jgi:HSP20 family protein
MSMIRRRPATESLVTMRDFFDRFFEDAMVRPSVFSSELFEAQDIPMDIAEEANDILVKASVPGVKPEALHIEVNEDRLRIWTEAKEEKETKETNYHLRERSYGRLERFVTLPYHVNADKAKAEFKDGVVTLTLPKMAEVGRKEIKVTTKA